MSITIKFRLFI